MNWISENKFLAGFIGFLVVGIAVLGFLVFQASGNYSDIHQDYLAKVQQLNQLQNQVPYRSPENLAKYKEQKTALADVINGLEQNLSSIQFPLEPNITPAGFQDKLRNSVNSVLATAQTNNVKLADKFALGFDRYLTGPPSKEAAAPLARQLDAVQFVVNELVDSRVDSITAINRPPLSEEAGGKPKTGLVVEAPLEISFISDQGKFRKILNDLAQSEKQFYIVRLIDIKNQVEKPVKKADALKSRIAKNGRPLPLTGAETLQVSLKLDIVNFNPPQK